MRIGLTRTLLLASLLASSLLTLALAITVAPLGAQSPGDRVEIIMGALPPQNSKEYKALLKIAGNPTGQVLSLTKCEMWHVRRDKLEALQKAAAARNVSVKVLDGSWNEMFATMGGPAAADPKLAAMMDLAKKSKSTSSVGMMSARNASMIEYALTKDMDKTSPAERPMMIKIQLKDNMTVTAIRREVVIVGDRCTWRGVIEGTEHPVTIMWWGTGRITGTVQLPDRLYQIKYLGNDTIGIVETMTDMMPDEHAAASPKRMQDLKMDKDKLVTEGDASAGRPRPKRGETGDAEDAIGKAAKIKLKPQPTKTAKGKAPAEPQVVIDVMVVYTAKAAAFYTDIKRDLIELSIEETNQSFKMSKIDNVGVRLVHVHKSDYVEDGAEHFDHLWRMVDRTDPFKEIAALRDKHKADVVILIVDDASGCGLATRVAADAEESYAVVHHECAATSYSVAHEIGHIIGARHDRSLDKSKGPFPYGHGFVSSDMKWRDLMSYKSACGGCPRLPIWSTPLPVYKGSPAGDSETDNARVIREQAARVAGFR